MTILVSGYYGYGNIGDEAVLRTLVNGFKRIDPAIRIIVLSVEPARTAEEYQVEAVPRFNLLALIEAIRRCDILLSGGGSLLQDATSRRSFVYYIGLIIIAKLLRKKVMIFAQGFGPLNGAINRRLARWVINHSDLVTLRDKDSLDQIRAMGIKNQNIYLTADPVFLLPADEKLKKEILIKEQLDKGRPLLGIALRPLPIDPEKQEKVFSLLAENIDRLVQEKNYLPVFMPFHRSDDLNCAARIAQKMAEKSFIIDSQDSPQEMLALISNCDFVIGARLHSLIFAAMGSIPMLGIAYDPKVAAFLNSINQPYITTGAVLQPGALEKALDGALVAKEASAISLNTSKVELYHQAELNFSLLQSYLIDRASVDFAGIMIDNVTLLQASDKVAGLIKMPAPAMIVTPNPEIIVAAQKDEELKNILNRSALRVPDGISLVVVSRMLGKGLKERVTGIDLMQQILKLAADRGYKIFLLGGGEGVAQAAADNLRKTLTGLKIAGTRNGYFSESDDSEVIKQIKSAGTEILFVGLGMGRQEKWLNHHLKATGVKIGMCVGGSMDVLSGRKKRAPIWVQKLYIEWLYRLIIEPQRWKRQLALPKFIKLLFLGR